MKYKTVMVRAVEGRLARVSPTGRTIPHDKFVPAEMTPYLDRLINHHGDVVVETDPERPAPRSVRPGKPPVDNDPPPPPPVATK
jgi:hypothetical protein